MIVFSAGERGGCRDGGETAGAGAGLSPAGVAVRRPLDGLPQEK